MIIRTRAIKKLFINPTAKSMVIGFKMFLFNILPAADLKTPCKPHSTTCAPFDLLLASYTSTA